MSISQRVEKLTMTELEDQKWLIDALIGKRGEILGVQIG